MAESKYGDNNIYTFQGGWNADGSYKQDQLPQPDEVTGYEQYDLGILEIDDEGDLLEPAQLEQVGARIRDARATNPAGAIVVAFVHGWHNNADWDNANLVSFRKLLRSLMTRELEALNRRVIGVYIGWNGSPTDGVGRWIERLPALKHATFRDRYDTAGQVGQGEAMGNALVELTHACKNPDPADASMTVAPLILIGHSMGAYILQSAFRELVDNQESPLFVTPGQDNTVSLETTSLGKVLAPDLLLSLNSAAEADVAKDIIERTDADRWTKRFDTTAHGGSVTAYHPPLLISATSEDDHATNWAWKAGHFMLKDSTDGHDHTLATHSFTRTDAATDCSAAGPIDFGQAWHCLHKDAAPGASPRFRIDLPDHDRTNGEPLTHTAYDLVPHDSNHPSPFWLFQVPGDVVADHTDIFNFKAASLVLAFIQLSGVLASAVGTGWVENFSEVALS